MMTLFGDPVISGLRDLTRFSLARQWRNGERESRTEYLEEAVATYRSGLAEYTRDRVPLDWARTQNGLGNALRALGEREKGTAQLKQAVDAHDLALSIFASPGLEHHSGNCRTDRDRAVALLKQRLGPDWDRHAAE
jgi:tetratricopeptide (TPR) repeat protein